MKKQNVGGQAVIEGVMMQSKHYRAIAVRKSNGEIELKKERISSWVNDKKIDKIPSVSYTHLDVYKRQAYGCL